MKILFIDGYNLFHRSRFGFSKGEYSTVFNFFRSFRALVEQMKADKVIVALEGMPNFRYEIYPEYKANRSWDKKDPIKVAEKEDFSRQRKIIVELLKKFPLELLYHPNYEGDDLIGKLATSVYREDHCVVITADTDFIQLFDQHCQVQIFNPVKKSWVTNPNYNYVLWKSMVGDTADNIKGIHRVGPKTAQKLLTKKEEELSYWLDEKPDLRREVVERNKRLIRFADVPLSEIKNLAEEPDLDSVYSEFQRMGFSNLTSDSSWNKFSSTFLD